MYGLHFVEFAYNGLPKQDRGLVEIPMHCAMFSAIAACLFY